MCYRIMGGNVEQSWLLPLNEHLLTGQAVNERLDQVAGGKVKDHTEDNRDRERGQCLSVHGQEQQRETKTLKKKHERTHIKLEKRNFY